MNDQLLIHSKSFQTIWNLFGLQESFSFIAGPCAVESREQMDQIARFLAKKNLKFIRGGAYKPRSSPYDFQGLGKEGLKILGEVREKYGLLTVSEIVDPRDVETCLPYLDMIQIGSRNMQNFALLKEVGKTEKPILIKRGMMATIQEFLYAAEYVVSQGNDRLILCERGIRTFEHQTRNTLDLSCVAIIKHQTSLPVIVDVSHSLGRTDIFLPMIQAAHGVGADGIMIEVHNDPPKALSDANQQIRLDEFEKLLEHIRSIS